MASPATVKAKLQALIEKVNEQTGQTTETMTQAVDIALAQKLEEAYGKVFSRTQLEQDELYAIGYNWFAQLVALAQQMSYTNSDLTPEQILAILGRVEYYPHIYVEQSMTPIQNCLRQGLKILQDAYTIELDTPTPGVYQDIIPKINNRLRMSFGGNLVESISFDMPITNNTIDYADLNDAWVYNAKLVRNTMSNYNGTILPPLPLEENRVYPYWVILSWSSGNVQAIGSQNGVYRSGNYLYDKNNSYLKAYYLNNLNWEKDTKQSDKYSGWSFIENSVSTIIYSNHNIPNGSATTSSIYYSSNGDATHRGYEIQDTWIYTSAEQEIDSGRMTAVKVITEDLETVESMVIR